MRSFSRFLAGVTASWAGVSGLWGCDASFSDQRPQQIERSDASELETPADGGDEPGTGAPIASGAMRGRAGHSASGTASLHRLPSGAIELRFSADFSASRVPSPIVLLSSREDIGANIDQSADLLLGRLTNASGAQSYSVPGGDGGRRVAWVYCQSFAVEIARAVLEDTP